MSITDELRKWAEDNTLQDRVPTAYPPPYAVHGALETLLRIADRIDAEHEKECSKAWMRGHDVWASVGNENVMAERGWVRLPVDADGVPIRVGDVMEWPTTGETFEVVGIGDGVLFYVEDGSEQADWTGASTKRHYHAPTVEDVLREFALACEDAGNAGPEVVRIAAEYAKRLTLAGDAE